MAAELPVECGVLQHARYAGGPVHQVSRGARFFRGCSELSLAREMNPVERQILINSSSRGDVGTQGSKLGKPNLFKGFPATGIETSRRSKDRPQAPGAAATKRDAQPPNPTPTTPTRRTAPATPTPPATKTFARHELTMRNTRTKTGSSERRPRTLDPM